MKILITTVMLGLSVYYLSCGSKNDSKESLNNLLFPDPAIPFEVDCGKIILANDIDPAYPVMHPYDLNYAAFAGDTLKLEVSYSGGCKEHGFCLIAWNYFLESFPVQAELLLSHNSYEDHCDARISSILNIDMLPLKEKYLKQYGGANGEILLRLRISSGEDINLSYKF